MSNSISEISITQNTITIQLDHYPVDDHKKFLQKLASKIESQTEIRITDFQYLGDSCGFCLIFEDTVFVLHLNDLAECLWIEQTTPCQKQLLHLKNRLSLIVD